MVEQQAPQNKGKGAGPLRTLEIEGSARARTYPVHTSKIALDWFDSNADYAVYQETKQLSEPEEYRWPIMP
jgi:hypothetical protein